jgi:hypothetical protein
MGNLNYGGELYPMGAGFNSDHFKKTIQDAFASAAKTGKSGPVLIDFEPATGGMLTVMVGPSTPISFQGYDR